MKNLIRYQILAFIPLVVLTAGSLFFHDLVKFAIDTNFTMNAIILGSMVVGVVIMHQLIWSIRRQSGKADVFIKRVQQGENMRVVLQDPDMGTSDIGIVCDHLVHSHDGVTGNPVDVVEAGLRSLHVTLDSRQELAQFMVGFLVALGLMGTFIGILETLVEIGNMIGGFASADMQDIDKSFMALISDLTKPLKGMGTAFSASMFGLLGSLCLGLTMVSVRRCTEEFLTGLRHAINQIIKDRRSSLTITQKTPAYRRSVDSGEDSSELLQQSLETQSKLLQKLETLDQHIGDLNSVMHKQVEGTAQTNELLRSTSVPRQATEQFMGQIKILATTSADNSTNLSSLLPALSGVSQNLNGFAETLMQQRDYVQKTMMSSAQTQDAVRMTLSSMVDKEADIHKNMLDEITQLRKFMLELQPISKQILPLVSDISSGINKQSVGANNQQETMRMLAQSVAQTFGGIKSGMTEMLQDAEKNRQIQSEISKQLMDTQGVLSEVAKLQQALDKVAGSLDNSLTTSQVMVEEVKRLRVSVTQELRRFEMQTALKKQDTGRNIDTPSGKGGQ